MDRVAILPFNLFTQIEIGVPGEWVEGKRERGVAGNLHGATETGQMAEG